MDRLLTILIVLCLLALATGPLPHAVAQDEIIVATDYWPPFRIKDGDDIVGIDRELVNEISMRLGAKVTIKRMPWARCLLEMEDGTVDMMTGIAKTKERAKYIAFSDIPYHTCRPAFYERVGRTGLPIEEYKDLYGVPIGFTRDSAYFEPFDSDPALTKIAANTEEQLINMTLDSRMDVFIGTDCQVDYDLLEKDLTDLISKTPYVPESKVDLFIGVSKNSTLIQRMPELNALLQEITSDGTVDGYVGKYLSKENRPVISQ